MKITPLAADSLGVRSMATLVETDDIKIAIDPDAALGPKRYGLDPHQKELDALKEAKKATHKAAKGSDIIIISHYHFDHFTIDGSWYNDKTLYVKSIKENINKSQTQRGTNFAAQGARLAHTRVDSDGKEFTHGKTRIKFSEAVPHGPPGVVLGYVIMTLIDDSRMKFIHGSDIQGPVSVKSTDWIVDQKPDLVYIDGPPILFLGWKFSQKNLDQSIENFQRILDETNAEIIVDHHLLRSLNYKEKFSFFDNSRVKTAAEYLGKENTMLEAHRKELWGK